MSAWWLLLIVPAAATLGITIMSALAARAYDRGYADGWERGREYAFVWTVTTGRPTDPSTAIGREELT